MVTFTIKIVEEGVIEVHASRPGRAGSSIELDVTPEDQQWFKEMGAYSLLEEDDEV